MRFCRFGDDRLGLVEARSSGTSPRRSTCCRSAGYPFPRTTCSSRTSTRRASARAQLAPNAPALAARRRDAAQPGGQPRQDRRGAGELPEASRRGARPIRSCTTTTRAHVHHPQRRAVPEGHQLARRSGAGRRRSACPIAAPITKSSWRSSSASAANRVVAQRTRWRTWPATRSVSTSRFAASEDRSFRKSPDSYSVLGPWLVTADEIPNPGALDLQISGQRRAPAAVEHAVHDSRRRRADRAGVVVLHAAPGRCHLHRHARRREPDPGRRQHRGHHRSDRNHGGRRASR